MTDELIYLPDLETALTAVYRGPLEDFVRRRDTLVKQLRAGKRKAEAETARALRKPSRTAWALNSVVHEDPAPIEHLADAINAALDAQASGTDLRAALDAVRSAVRAAADAAAHAAQQGGHPLDTATLVPAIMAVIGDAGAFALLRAGRLADVPEGGGLDFLTAAPPAAPRQTSAALPERDEFPDVAQNAEAERAALQKAEALLEESRRQSERAQRALAAAQAKLEAAEATLRRAQEEVASQREDVDRARQEVKRSAAQLHDAERAVDRLPRD